MRIMVLCMVLVCACADFGLDGRRYRCDTDPMICGPGWSCGADGFCTSGPGPVGTIPDAAVTDGARDAAAPDAEVVSTQFEVCDNLVDDDRDQAVDCLDEDCGAISCMDTNPCTSDVCLSHGACGHEPVAVATSCGPGCVCAAAAEAVETACDDLLDNDDDGRIDCQDASCPACRGASMCCADGSCRARCN